MAEYIWKVAYASDIMNSFSRCYYLRVSETARFLCAAHEHEWALEHRIATALSCSKEEHCVELKLRYKKTLNKPWFKVWLLTKFTALTTIDNTSLKFSGRVCLKMLVLRTPCCGVWYPQGVRVPPVKNHCNRMYSFCVFRRIFQWFRVLVKLSTSGFTTISQLFLSVG